METHGRWPVVGAVALIPVSALAAKRPGLRPLAALLWHQTEEWVWPGSFLPWVNREVLGSDEDEFPIDRRLAFIIDVPLGWGGSVAAPGICNPPALRAATAESVTYPAAGTPVSDTYTGVGLWDLLNDAGGVSVTAAKNDILSKYVVATGADGYKAVFSLGEIAPHLPGKLTIGAQSGPLTGPLDLRDVHFRNDTLDLRLGHLHLAWKAGKLRQRLLDIDQLHADGVGLFTDYGDTWLGDARFAPVFAELNRRKAVVYVHPTAGTCCRALLPEIPPSAIEYGTDTTRAIAHMVFTGFAQQYPDIKLIWSHAGGTMPFLIERFEFLEKQPEFAAKLPSGFRGEIRKYYYDTAQSANPIALRGISQLVPASQMVFGSDYPFRGIAEQVKSLHKAGVYNAEELRAIDRGNAARLLGRPRV